MFIRFATCFCVTALLFTPTARADLFGTGGNTFTIDFVPIGNPNNAADTTGAPNPAGSVAYSYNMGTYEISRDMITKANAEGGLGITLSNMTSFGGNGVDRPATGISWYEAATFTNWLNTSKGSNAAYKFDGSGNFQLWDSGDAGYDASNPFRNSLANYILPSSDEWYKAAYFNSTTGTYGDYPTSGGTLPTAVASGTTDGTAVYGQSDTTGPADITNAGGLSAYGTMGQGGNVWEWEETTTNLLNNSGSSVRGIRGGGWNVGSINLSASFRLSDSPTDDNLSIGFRVASLDTAAVPEPGSLALLSVLGVCGLWRLRRRLCQ